MAEPPLVAVQALARLLAAAGPDGDGDGEEGGPPRGGSRHAGPGSIGPSAKRAASAEEGGGAIWSAAEVPDGAQSGDDDAWDGREQPEYEVLFQQHVGAEDVFLGVSRRDPSTACCEDLLIRIKLPETKAADVTLDIREQVLDLRSPQKKLLLHLPHPVDTASGKACFLSEQGGILEVTLRMKRELDFINFA